MDKRELDKLTGLIVRLEKATEGSRELDALIWQQIEPDAARKAYWEGRAFCNRDWAEEEKERKSLNNVMCQSPHYTSSLDAKLPGENIVSVMYQPDGGWSALHDTGGNLIEGVHPNSEAIARRIAALKARASSPGPR